MLHQSCDVANPEQFCEQLLEIYIRIVAAFLVYGEPHFHRVFVPIRHSSTIKLLLLSELISDLAAIM